MNKKDNSIKNMIEKYNTDNKYKAKVQLIGGFGFILLLIIYLNISSANSINYGNITSIKNDPSKPTEEPTTTKTTNLLERIIDNYEYETKITYIDDKDEREKEIKYYGKSYKKNLEITKEVNNEKFNYYKVDTRYYKKNEDTYDIIKDEEVYDVIEKEQIELNDIKEYINLASLDHVTDYSSGKKEYVYHLKVKDIIKSYQEQDEIEISITEENNILTINIDYTNLIKVLSKEIKECKIESIYKNIDAVEEFTIIEENNQNEQE